MTLLAIDPSTSSMGFAVYVDGKPVKDGYKQFSVESPLKYLSELTRFLDGVDREYPVNALATEQMFIGIEGNRAALLNVSVDQMKAWCDERDVWFLRYQNSTVKRLVAGKGGAEKEEVRRVVERNMSDEAKALPKKHIYDVSDAHAIALTAIVSKYGPARSAPKKSRKKK